MNVKPVPRGFINKLDKLTQGLIFQAFSLLFILAFCKTSYCQDSLRGVVTSEFRVKEWNRSNGLSLPKKNVMLKDVKGFLWIISPVGLNRFDGSTFKVFHPDKTTPGSIGGSYSFSLVEDSLHNIWVGTNKGLSRYDIRADTFSNFSPETLSVTSVATVVPFWATKDEVYCMEAGYQLTMYNIHSFKKKIVAQLDKEATAGTHATIPHSVYDVKSNSIWIISGKPDVPGGGLLQVSLTDKQTIVHEWSCYHNIKNHAHYAYGMRYDSSRYSLWVNTVDGLLEFTLADKKFHSIYACNDLFPISRYEVVAGIDLDKTGKIWLYTNAKGILVYDPVTKNATPLFKDPELQIKFSDDNMSIYNDRDGMVWLGNLSVKSVHQLMPFSSAVSQVRLTTDETLPVISIVQGEHGMIWINTNDGINAYDPVTGITKQMGREDFPGLYTPDLVAIASDSVSRKIWFWDSEKEKFYEMDAVSRESKEIFFKDLLHQKIDNPHLNYRSVSRYKKGFIFLMNKKGIFTLNCDSAVAQQIIHVPYHVTNMALIGEKKLFLRLHFAFTNLSFREVNGKWERTATALDSIEWASIFFDDADQSYWVGGIKTLYHYDKDFRLIRRYTDKDGLAGIDVLAILKDNSGNIWLTDSDGQITRLNAQSGLLTHITEYDGYAKQKSDWNPPVFKDTRGELYFAGFERLDRINPDKIGLYPAPAVYFKSLYAYQKELPLDAGVDNLKELSLEYFQSPLVIETGTIDYYSKGTSNIRYKLEDINADWQYAPANYTIRYEKLPPGRYTLVIQASNSGNNFSGPEKKIVITVNPPFWNTWWFRIMAFLSVVAFIYLFLRYRLKEKYHWQIERSIKDRQLADMRQKTTELEMQALRAQMNPHFIFNSLNSINRFILQNNRTQASEFLTKFSKLVRLILQNSRAPLITLESELESLRLYIELEALRFDYHFNYKITIPESLDIFSLKVPPLIVQPYVENAIWHGLMHKDERGNLEIEVSEENELLILRIADDGVGRKYASALKRRFPSDHKSMGLQITADRIERLRPASMNIPAIQIRDLIGADGSPAGTEIILTIPVIYD